MLRDNQKLHWKDNSFLLPFAWYIIRHNFKYQVAYFNPNYGTWRDENDLAVATPLWNAEFKFLGDIR